MTYNSNFYWCSHALLLAGVTVLEDFYNIWFRYFLVLAGFPLHFEQVNIDLIMWYNEKSETTANYKSLAVCNIATRSYHLLEFHFLRLALFFEQFTYKKIDLCGTCVNRTSTCDLITHI